MCLTKPPRPPSDNPFLPNNIELTSLDGETDLDSLSELDATELETADVESKPLEPHVEDASAEVDWSGDLGDHAKATEKPALEASMFAGVALANLDGTGPDDEAEPAPAPAAAAPDPFGPPLDLTAPLAAHPATAPSPTASVTSQASHTTNTAPPNASAFAAPSYEDVPMQLDMSLKQMVAEKTETTSEKIPDDVELAVPDPNAFIPIPGRFMEGRLRENASLHIAIGLALALGIGYVAARPVQRRSEMRIEYLRQQAAVERARPHEEAQATAVQLDAKAESESTKAFVIVAALWLGIAGGLFALYWRFT